MRSSAPLYIPTISVSYTREGRVVRARTREEVIREGTRDREFRVGILPTPNGEDVEKILVSYREGPQTWSRTLDREEEVGGMAASLLGSEERELDLSLLEVLRIVFGGLEQEEKEHLAETCDWGSSGGLLLKSQDQSLIHLWMVGVGTYLGFLALLEEGEVWSRLPFPFTLPVLPTLRQALTQECAQYMILPIRGLWNVSSGLLRAVVDTIIGFLNTWGSSFQPGLPQDRARVQVETISGYSMVVLENLGTVEGRLMQRIQEEHERLYCEEEEDLATRIRSVAIRLEDRLLLKTGECERRVGNQVANARIEFQLILQGEQSRIREELQKQQTKFREELRSEMTEMKQEIRGLVEDAKTQLKDWITETVTTEIQTRMAEALTQIRETETRVRKTLEPRVQERKLEEKEENAEPRGTFRFHRRR